MVSRWAWIKQYVLSKKVYKQFNEILKIFCEYSCFLFIHGKKFAVKNGKPDENRTWTYSRLGHLGLGHLGPSRDP